MGSKLLLGSASGLGRALACPAQICYDEYRERKSSEAAARGHRLHKFAELAPEDLEAGLGAAGKNRKTAEKILVENLVGARTTPELREKKFVYDYSTGEAYAVENDRERDYGDDLPETAVPGTIDVVIMRPDNIVEIWDYKFGKGVVLPYNNKQLIHGALMVHKTIAPDAMGFVVGIQQYVSGGGMPCKATAFGRDRLEQHEADLQVAGTKARLALRVYQSGKDPMVNAGEHCAWCPGKQQGKCPAWR